MARGDREVTDGEERVETAGNKRGKLKEKGTETTPLNFFFWEKRKRKGKIIIGRTSIFLSQDRVVPLVPL